MQRTILISLFTLFSFVSGTIQAEETLQPLEEGKALRAKADAGDADAMFKLGILLLEHGPTPKRPGRICDGKPVNPLIKPKPGANCVVVQDEANAALVEQWSAVGTKFTAQSWISRAAESGNRQAMELLCKLSNDPLAPAALSEEGTQWCERMQSL